MHHKGEGEPRDLPTRSTDAVEAFFPVRIVEVGEVVTVEPHRGVDGVLVGIPAAPGIELVVAVPLPRPDVRRLAKHLYGRAKLTVRIEIEPAAEGEPP